MATISSIPMDTSFEQRVHAAIHENPFLAGRRLQLEMDGGRVILHGTVGSYFQKQMAQESLRAIAGVTQIDNRLEVFSL